MNRRRTFFLFTGRSAAHGVVELVHDASSALLLLLHAFVTLVGTGVLADLLFDEIHGMCKWSGNVVGVLGGCA